MKKVVCKVILSLIVLLGCTPKQDSFPAPFGPTPTSRQMAWHDTEFYAFIHLTLNTFTDKEWGFGDESPVLFNPTEFDAEQIVSACKNAGMKGLILTAKHHDGFCLWPTETTGHNITKSPYKNGRGDIVREIVDACRKYGLKVGMYVSPWDRNNPDYGKPEYISVFRGQLTELLTNYGDVFEVWFDGANGGTGYYGGANEERKIDRKTYYDWENTFKLVHELQPNAVIFSDIGPGTRWVGNEEGYAGDPCWHRFTPKGRDGNKPGIGESQYWEAENGHREGEFWIPAEVDVSIRPGWFHHESENHRVKSPERLVEIYYHSLGRGANLILNIPPDQRGLIHENDLKSLDGFHKIINATFSTDLAQGSKISASNIRNGSKRYGPVNLLDNDQESFWSTDDGITDAHIVLEFPKTTEFNVVNLREYLPLGQRIWGWALDKWENNEWKEFAKGESIGNRRLWRGSLQTTKKMRVRITEAPVCPILTQLSVHLEPVKLDKPKIDRSKTGAVKITGNGTIRYTLDGTEPNAKSTAYTNEIPFPRGGTVKSKIFYQGKSSETATANFSHSKHKWKVVSASSFDKNREAAHVIDENKNTFWQSTEDDRKRELIIGFEETLDITAFSMLPPQDGAKKGMVTHFEFYTSLDGENWELSKAGEFSNVVNNPIAQQVSLDAAKQARFVKFKATKVFDADYTVIAELNVIVAK